MPKRPQRMRQIRGKLAETAVRVHTFSPDQTLGLDYEEVISVTCGYFLRGFTVGKIADLLTEKYNVNFSREVPYKLIQQAGLRGFLKYSAPDENSFNRLLRHDYPWLRGIKVLHTALAEQTVETAVLELLARVREYTGAPFFKDEVHIGLGSGYLVSKVLMEFLHIVEGSIAGLPKRIVLHPLVAPAADPEKALTDPLVSEQDTDLPTEIRFVPFTIPSRIPPSALKLIWKLPEIEYARQQLDSIDILLTSASSVEDPHTALSLVYPIDELESDGCVGELFGLPFGASGFLDTQKYQYIRMALIQPDTLSSFIKRGKCIMLVLGPCNQCTRPKTDILRTILESKDPLISDLVADSRTVRGIFGGRQSFC